jgi:hypothetical protein
VAVSSSSPTLGDVVLITWGVAETRGRVIEVYGAAGHRQVVLELTPELSGDMFVEPTTVSLPIDEVRLATAAA